MIVLYLVLVISLVIVNGVIYWTRHNDDGTPCEDLSPGLTKLLYWQTIVLMVLAIALVLMALLI